MDRLPDTQARPSAGLAYRAAAATAFSVFKIQRWQFDIAGLGHVPDTGGAVIAANHCSFWDFFTVGVGPYGQRGRPLRILAKESLFRTPVFGPIMRKAEHIPVHRGSGTEALRSAVAALKSGELVLVLPEQTISTSFELLPFKTGAARMACAAGVPLVPVATWGSQRFNTVGHRPKWSWKLPVTVRFGAPMRPAEHADIDAVTGELRARVETLLHDCQRAYPEAAVPGNDWWQPARLGGSAPTHEDAVAELTRLRVAWEDRRSA